MNSEKEEKVDTNQSPRDILRITSLLKKRKNLFLDLIQLDQEVLDKEFLDFSKDLEYYGKGALLWANEKYPKMINYFSILYGKVFNIVRFKTKMKDVVDEFFDFTEEVKRSYKKLYLKEKESTQKLVFNNEIKPMDFLTKKIPSIKFINNLLMYLKQQLQSYSDKIQPILQSYSLKISELKESIFKNISKTEFLDNIHQEIDIENDQIKKKRKTWKIVTSLLFYLENSEDVRNFLSEFKEQFKDIQEEAFPDLDESVKKILDENKRFLEKLDEETFAYMNLNLIKNVDSFHIKFSKYIARLYYLDIWE